MLRARRRKKRNTFLSVSGFLELAKWWASDDMFIPAFLPNATIVKSQDGFYRSVQPDYLNSLSVIEVGVGYMVHNSKDETLTITGREVSSLSPAGLRQGWNLIGVPYATETPFSNVFDNTNCQSIKDFNGFWQPDGGTYSIENFEPGKAYFVKVK